MATISETDLSILADVADIAEQIGALASNLDRPLRHQISDAAALIGWIAYGARSPAAHDEATAAMRDLLASLSSITAE